MRLRDEMDPAEVGCLIGGAASVVEMREIRVRTM